MSLAEQIQRVDGSQNDILKKVLGAFGVTVGENKIDRLAALAKLAPLLKENSILSSDTRALYNLDTDAVPDDVLANLGVFRYGVGNEYVWAKQEEKKVYSEKSYSSSSLDTVISNKYSNPQTFFVSSTLEDALNGVSEEESIDMDSSQARNSLLGKYIVNKSVSAEKIFFIPSDASLILWSSPYQYSPTKATVYYDIKSEYKTIGYVNSPDPDAYPPSVPDEYTYTPLGQLGSKVQIATGSYVGTGKYGSSNPNSLTFEFEPKMVIISRKSGGITASAWPAYIMGLFFPYAMSSIYSEYGYGYICINSGELTAKEGSFSKININSMSWYSNHAENQLNETGALYEYLAIG